MRLRNFAYLTFLLLIALFSVTTAAQEKRVIVLRNVTVIDMRSEEPRPNMTVLIKGDRIVKIGKYIKIPKNAEVVDASERFLIPGLWDNYTYTLEAVKNNFPFFELLIAYGETKFMPEGDLRRAFFTPDWFCRAKCRRAKASAGREFQSSSKRRKKQKKLSNRSRSRVSTTSKRKNARRPKF
jgi:hypothetical protein